MYALTESIGTLRNNEQIDCFPVNSEGKKYLPHSTPVVIKTAKTPKTASGIMVLSI